MADEWVPFLGQIEQEDELGITLFTLETGYKIRIRIKKNDYRIVNGAAEVRVGSIVEWFDPLLSCKLKA